MSDLKFNTPFDPTVSCQKNLRNLTGQRFNRLLVLSIYGQTDRGSILWLCKCDCGNIRIVVGYNLMKKKFNTQSCGCWRREKLIPPLIHGQTQGGAISLTYRSFIHAKGRCTNPREQQWKRYGGRGIEFRFESFADFLAEVGERPSPKHTLDRINNDGHYEKGNIRWATFTEQARNTSRTRYITLHKVTKSLSEWCELFQIKRQVVASRLHLGWSEIDALSKPLHFRHSNKHQ